MYKEKTYLEKVIEEAIGPTIGALDMLAQEFSQAMNMPDAPWKILNKPYDQLNEQEIMALFDIYHVDGEVEPCPMCNWVSRMELMKSRQEKMEGL